MLVFAFRSHVITLYFAFLSAVNKIATIAFASLTNVKHNIVWLRKANRIDERKRGAVPAHQKTTHDR